LFGPTRLPTPTDDKVPPFPVSRLVPSCPTKAQPIEQKKPNYPRENGEHNNTLKDSARLVKANFLFFFQKPAVDV